MLIRQLLVIYPRHDHNGRDETQQSIPPCRVALSGGRRDGRFGSKVGQIGSIRDKSGTFQIRFQYIMLARQYDPLWAQIWQPRMDWYAFAQIDVYVMYECLHDLLARLAGIASYQTFLKLTSSCWRNTEQSRSTLSTRHISLYKHDGPFTSSFNNPG